MRNLNDSTFPGSLQNCRMNDEINSGSDKRRNELEGNVFAGEQRQSLQFSDCIACRVGVNRRHSR
jgi:hypothetical protein